MTPDRPRVRMLDPRRQHADLRERMHQVAAEVIDSGWYLLGERTRKFEQEFSAWVGRAHGVACANGTDAITLALWALGLRSGDEVITVANTAFASACGISRAGGCPVFVDIDPHTWLLDPEAVAARVTPRTRAVLAVHLYGQVIDIERLASLLPAQVAIVEDCAQAHGAGLRDRRVGSLAVAATFSFYPTKNLGAVGDAGMVVTGEGELAESMRALRFYGQRERDRHVAIGMNSRMDEIQAALLELELGRLDAWVRRRREIAGRYDAALDPVVFTRPVPVDGAAPSHHLYVVRVADRDRFRAFLDERGIDTAVHYPGLIPFQDAYRELGYEEGDLPHAERLVREIVSLPVSPHLSDEEVGRVIESCREYAGVVSG